MATPLLFVTKIRDLTVKEENRYFIIKDQGCLKGLVSYLHISDSQVVLISLEAIQNLVLSPSIRDTVASQKGLQQSLRLLADHSSEPIKQLASSLYSTLQPHFPRPRTQHLPSSAALEVVDITPLRDCTNKDNTPVSSGNKSAPRSITLYITGLTNDVNRKELESALLQVRGVISFLIDLYSQKAVIRTRSSAEALIQAVQSIGMQASLRKHAASSHAKENNVEPDYLDDEEEVVDNSKVLSTVESTKENQKNNNQANNNGGGWGWNRLAKALWG